MSWEDDLKKKYGLNKPDEEHEKAERIENLRAELAIRFGDAAEELDKAQKLLALARKQVSLSHVGSGASYTLTSGTHSLGIKMRDDGMGFDITEDGQVSDSVVVHFHMNRLILNSIKSQELSDIRAVMGRLIGRFDGRIS